VKCIAIDQGEEVNLMRKYETLFILNPSLDDEAIKANVEKFKAVIENGGGTVDNVDAWGKRKLAYEIKKINEGYYTLINFTADSELPKELDRIFRITDSIVRHLIIREEE
jgi:small subunit ribosomal protein S6